MLSSCKKDDEYTKYDAPQWAVTYDEFESSMTGVITVPGNIASYVDSLDIVAAFIGEECRGIAEYNSGYFYINIVGASDEAGLVTFKYYSSKNRYLYAEENLMSFTADKVFGTSDNPYILTLKNQ